MTYRTLGFLVTLALGLLVVPLVADAQPLANVHRIGRLSSGSPPGNDPNAQVLAFRQGLRDLGYIEGQNLVIEYRWAEDREERLPALAAELVRLPVDVLVAAGAPAARAAQQATTTLPIVIVTRTDPVRGGFVSSLAHPGGNLTGVSGPDAEFIGKQLALLKEAVPGVTRVAVLMHPTHPMAAAIGSELASAARALGVELHLLDVHDAHALDTTLAAMTSAPAEVLLVPPFPLFDAQRKRILDVTAQSRLPVFATDGRGWVEEGAVMFYGPSTTATHRRAAAYVDKILKGAKPGDLPVEQPMNFELVINLKTAQALGLAIPPPLLFQATEVIR
jgi:putative tryptophan/tyrosine transport system substrate-binding protein